MSIYSRRTFVKGSSMLAATAAVNRIFTPSVVGQTAFNRMFGPANETSVSGGSALREQGPQKAMNRGPDHPFFRNMKRPEVIAHRGGNGQWPGETMYAFQQAVNMKVDILEMDVHSTSDGELVLMHNDSVNETTNDKGCIKEKTWKALQQLDAGYLWPGEQHDLHPFRDLGIKVPLLDEVLNAFPDKRMIIEIKQTTPSIVEPFCKMLEDRNLISNVLVASFFDSVIEEVRCRLPGIATSASPCEFLKLSAGHSVVKGFSTQLESACQSLGSIISSVISPRCNLRQLVKSFPKRPPCRHELHTPDAIQMKGVRKNGGPLITKEFVETARSKNLVVHAWTINRPEDMLKMIAADVDGIITDYPGPLLELLRCLKGAQCSQFRALGIRS
jgi:glycerophosphoryl diester phosphodiesterase